MQQVSLLAIELRHQAPQKLIHSKAKIVIQDVTDRPIRNPICSGEIPFTNTAIFFYVNGDSNDDV
jgi:hypothetical protein